MKRRRIVFAVSTLAVLLGFGWLLIISRQDSADSARIKDAARALFTGNPQTSQAGQKTIEEFGSRATAVLARQASRKEGLLMRLRRKVSPLVPQSWRARISRLLPARDPFVEKVGALRALGLLGTNAVTAVPAMEVALTEPQSPVAWEAAVALAKTGEEGIPPLIRSIQSSNSSARLAAVYGLSLAGTNAAPAVTNLVGLLSDSNLALRVAVQDSLLRIGAPAVEPLARAALALDEHTRTGAVHVLHVALCDTRAAMQTFIRASRSDDPVIRGFAAHALGQVRPWETNAVLVLVELLDDPVALVRLAATRSLYASGLRAAPAVPRLAAQLRDESSVLREATLETLARLGAHARPALPELESCLGDPSESVRRAATNAVASVRAGGASPRLP
jgi:HEAT repeat protein